MPSTTRTTKPVRAPRPTAAQSGQQATVVAFRTAAEDKLWEALHSHPHSSAADLSAVAKIGKSTAQKILARWAADGSVTRTPGITGGGRRAADLWAITDIDTA